MDVAAAGNAMVFSATERLREVDEEAVAQFTKEEKVSSSVRQGLKRSSAIDADLRLSTTFQQARRKEQNRLAQQDLRRRRATHTRDVSLAPVSDHQTTE